MKECAADLYKSKGQSVILLGDHLSQESHALVFYLNELLSAPIALLETGNVASEITDLADSINSGSVKH